MPASRRFRNTCHAAIDPVLWDGMSADARYQAQKDLQQISPQSFLRALLWWGALSPPLLFMALPPVQRFVESFTAPEHRVTFAGQVDPRQYLNTSEPKVGQMIAGYAVSSDYGYRIHPVTGQPHTHRGADIATPTGTPLYAPAVKNDTVTVHCWQDAHGGGNVAEISSQSIKGYRFKALHLSECTDGTYQAGEVFAKTGATGLGTGRI